MYFINIHSPTVIFITTPYSKSLVLARTPINEINDLRYGDLQIDTGDTSSNGQRQLR